MSEGLRLISGDVGYVNLINDMVDKEEIHLCFLSLN